MSKGIELLDGDRWRQCVALARRSEEQGRPWKYSMSKSVEWKLKMVVARLEKGDGGRSLVT